MIGSPEEVWGPSSLTLHPMDASMKKLDKFFLCCLGHLLEQVTQLIWEARRKKSPKLDYIYPIREGTTYKGSGNRFESGTIVGAE